MMFQLMLMMATALLIDLSLAFLFATVLLNLTMVLGETLMFKIQAFLQIYTMESMAVGRQYLLPSFMLFKSPMVFVPSSLLFSQSLMLL
uniref:NADH dehydrogenase subunit 4L n=1 Tax=Plectus sambesii TaxID=2011161 RepID=A0A914VB43_9BILA